MQKSTVFLLVVALASAGVSAGLWMQLRAERTLNAELGERLAAATATPVTPAPVTTAPAAPSPSITPVVATDTPAPIATAEPAIAKPPRVGGPEDWQTRQRRLMSDPKFREAFREQERLRLATRRENFVRLLGFTPEQADAVIDLSIERQMDSQRRMPSGEMTAEEILRRNDSMEADEREHEAKLRNLLGDTKAAQLETYMESRQRRMQVDRFRMQLRWRGPASRRPGGTADRGAAYRAARRCRRICEAHRETANSASDPVASQRQFAERQAEALKAAHKRMHSAAAPILSSAQLEKLDAMLKRDLERHEAQQRMSRIQSKFEQP